MSVEFYRGSPGEFDSRTLSRKTLNRWTGRITTYIWYLYFTYIGMIPMYAYICYLYFTYIWFTYVYLYIPIYVTYILPVYDTYIGYPTGPGGSPGRASPRGRSAQPRRRSTSFGRCFLFVVFFWFAAAGSSRLFLAFPSSSSILSLLYVYVLYILFILIYPLSGGRPLLARGSRGAPGRLRYNMLWYITTYYHMYYNL